MIPIIAKILVHCQNQSPNVSIFWMERIPMGKLIDNISMIGLYICVFSGLSLASFTLKDIR